jgi:membrane protein
VGARGRGPKGGEDRTEFPGLSEAQVRAVARRPIRGSAVAFFKDLRTLLGFATLKRAIVEFQKDDVLGLAAQLAFYLILALFPFVLVLVTVMGTFSNEAFASDVLDYFGQVLPGPVFELVQRYLDDVLAGRSKAPTLLSFGIIGTIWAASGAFSAIINSLNRAYDVEETRPFWKVKGLAVLMTFGLSGLILVGVLLMLAGPIIGEQVANIFGLGDEFVIAWNIVRWPVALLFLVVVIALIYYFAPNVRQPFRWITPGGVVAVALWLLASVAFRLYVASPYNTYGANGTYGPIATVIVLLLYLYISSVAILFGAELNATLVQLKGEISGHKLLDAEPADEGPSVAAEETREG